MGISLFFVDTKLLPPRNLKIHEFFIPFWRIFVKIERYFGQKWYDQNSFGTFITVLAYK